MPSFMSSLVRWLIPFSGIKADFVELGRFERRIARSQAAGPAAPSGSLKRKYRIETERVQGHLVHTVTPPSPAKLELLYLHGGAYVFDLDGVNWNLVDGLAARTNARVTVPVYPLAPKAGFPEMFSLVQELHERLITRGHPVVLVGDSAGAGLALSSTMVLRDERRSLPSKLVLFSPWLDVTCADPRQETELNHLDPILGLPGLRRAGTLYAHELAPADPRISPLFGAFEGLPPTLVQTGSRDVLYADALRLEQRMTTNLRVSKYPEMVHDWMALPMPEATQALDEAAAFITG